MSTHLPPVLTDHTVSGSAEHTTISLAFSEAMERGSGMVIVTDGAIQTVIDRASGLPGLRVVGATETHEIPLSMVGIEGNQVTINADSLQPGHQYNVFIAPGVLQSNGQPFAGVTSSSALSFTTPADITPPSLLHMGTDNYVLTPGKSATLTMLFSEPVRVDASAIVAPNVKVTGLAGSADGMTWHATITPETGIEVASSNVSVDMRGVHDKFNNAGVGSQSVAYLIDTKVPTVASIELTGTTPVLSGDATVKVTFSEYVNIGNPSAVIVAPHASVSEFHTIDDGKTWIGKLAPQSGTTSTGNQLYVDLSLVTDRSGNAGSGTANAGSTYTVDTQGPGFKDLALSGGPLTIGGHVTLTIHMQEPVAHFDKAAIIAPNLTVGDDLSTTDGGLTWTVTLTPQPGVTASDNMLSLDLSKVSDANGVVGSGRVDTPNAYSVDTAPPTAELTLSSTKLSPSKPVYVTIKFSEPMKTLDKAAIVAPHATVDSLTSVDGITWTAKLVPDAVGGTSAGNKVALDMSMVSDVAGNSGTGMTETASTYDLDAAAPTTIGVSLAGSHVTSTSGPALTLTFSEAVSLTASAISVPHAKLSDLHTTDGGTTWVATVVADGSGNASGSVAVLDMTQVKDLSGNAGTGSESIGSYDVQVTAPTATITLVGSQVTQKGTVGLKVVFSQAVKALDPSWFTAPNAEVSTMTTADGGVTWTGTLSSHASQTAIHNTLSLDMSQVQDYFGNYGSGSAGAASAYDVDTVSPTVTSMIIDSASLTPTSSAVLTVKFSEPVKNLETTDFTTPHAKLANLTMVGDGSTWTATLVADGGASATGNVLSLAMDALTDLAGNAGVGSVSATTSYDVVYPATQGASISLDHTALSYGGSIWATITFTQAVPELPMGAIATPNATVQHLHTENEGLTWYVELAASAPGVVDATNAISIDMTQVHDSSGAAGSGTVTSENYTVDTSVASYIDSISMWDDNGPSMIDFVTNQTTVNFEGTLQGTLASNEHIQLTIDSTVSDVDTYENSWWSVGEQTLLSDGEHTVTVSVVDDAGHASAVITHTLFIDTGAPAVTGTWATTGTATTPGSLDVTQPLAISFDEQVYWHAVSVDESSYSDADNAVTVTDAADSANPYYVYIDTRNLASDGHTLTLSADDLHLTPGHTYAIALPKALTDLAGNEVGNGTLNVLATGSYSDTVAPSALSAQVLDAPGDFGVGSTVHIAVRFSEPVMLSSATAPYLSLNNGAEALYDSISPDGRTVHFNYTVGASDSIPPGDYNWLDLAGTGNLVDTIADLAGNALDAVHVQFSTLTSTYADLPGSGIGIDVTPPSALSAPQLTTAGDSGVQGDHITNSPIISGAGADTYAAINVYDVSGGTPQLVGTSWADSLGNWEFDWWYGADGHSWFSEDGSYSVVAAQVDQAGNESALSDPLTFTLDRYAAGPNDGIHVVGSYSATNLISATATPTLAGTHMEPGATVTLYDYSDNSVLGSGLVDETGGWSLTTVPLTEGDHPIYFTQTDKAGNVGDSAGFTLVVDLTAPAMPTLTSSDITKLMGTGEAGAKLEVFEASTSLGSVDVGSDGTWSLALSLSLATHNLVLHQTDKAGNVSPDLDLVLTGTPASFYQPHLLY